MSYPEVALVQVLVTGKWAEHANGIEASVASRLDATARCANDRWHASAPARTIELCPECPR